MNALEHSEVLDEVSTDTGYTSDACSSVVSAPTVTIDDELAPAVVEPWDMYDEFALECDAVPSVAGHTTNVTDGVPTCSATVTDDDELNELGASDSDEGCPHSLVDSSSDEEGGRPKRTCRLRTSPSVPAMPTSKSRRRRHRDKCSKSEVFPWNAAVARPVGKAEIVKTPDAKRAMAKEWTRLRDKRVWIEEETREWDEVRAEAKRLGHDVHLGYLFGICVQKNSEFA